MQLMREISPEEVKAISKYGRRGFQIVATYLWPFAGSDPCLVLDTVRNVNDRFTWRVALDTTGVEPRPKLTPTSDVMKTDPVVQNSWEMCNVRGSNLTITYFAVKSTLLRYNYVVAENDYLLQLLNWLRVQGFYEHEKVEGLSGEEKSNAWTWCVGCLHALLCPAGPNHNFFRLYSALVDLQIFLAPGGMHCLYDSARSSLEGVIERYMIMTMANPAFIYRSVPPKAPNVVYLYNWWRRRKSAICT